MIGLKGRLNIIDNSGGIIAECIRVAKVKTRHGSSGFAGVGDEIGVVINKARPISLTPTTGPGSVGAGSSNIQKVRKGDIRRAVVVRTRKEERREDGRYVKFDDTACVLLNAKSEMIGTRVNGVVSNALRDVQGGAGAGGKWAKILSLAPKVI